MWFGIGRNHWESPSVFRHHTVNVWTTVPQVISYRWLPSLQALCIGGKDPNVPPYCSNAEAWNCTVPRWSMLLLLICIHPYTQPHTQTHKQSHLLSLLSSRFTALLPMMLRPHFVLTSTYPPSVVSCLAQVCTVGLMSVQGVNLDRIICCSVYPQMSLMLHSHAKLETNPKT